MRVPTFQIPILLCHTNHQLHLRMQTMTSYRQIQVGTSSSPVLSSSTGLYEAASFVMMRANMIVALHRHINHGFGARRKRARSPFHIHKYTAPIRDHTYNHIYLNKYLVSSSYWRHNSTVKHGATPPFH